MSDRSARKAVQRLARPMTRLSASARRPWAADLSQAITELRSSGSPDTLYLGFVFEFPFPVLTRPLDAIARNEARRRRVAYARTAILYCILAAEAYVNGYLEWGLSKEESRVIDRLPTFDKYMLGPRLVGEKDDASSQARTPPDPSRATESPVAHRPPQTVSGPGKRSRQRPGGLRPVQPVRRGSLSRRRRRCGKPPLLPAVHAPEVGAEVAFLVLERHFFLEYGKRATADLPPLRADPRRTCFARRSVDGTRRADRGLDQRERARKLTKAERTDDGQPRVPHGGVAASPSRRAYPRSPSVRAVRFHRAARCPPSRRTRSRAGRASAVQPRGRLPAMPHRIPPPGAPAGALEARVWPPKRD